MPSSAQSFSRDVPLIAPVISNAASYCAFSILLINASLSGLSYTISPQSRSGLINAVKIVTRACLGSLLERFLFYVSIVIEFFIKIHANMLLNGSLGDWYIIEMYGRIILFCIFPCKNNFLCLFWGIWVKRHFPCVGPITNFIEIIVKL